MDKLPSTDFTSSWQLHCTMHTKPSAALNVIVKHRTELQMEIMTGYTKESNAVLELALDMYRKLIIFFKFLYSE